MEFHRARTARRAGAAAPAMPKHRRRKALAVARATASGLLVAPEARFQRDAGPARPKAIKPHEKFPDRLLELASKQRDRARFLMLRRRVLDIQDPDHTIVDDHRIAF